MDASRASRRGSRVSSSPSRALLHCLAGSILTQLTTIGDCGIIATSRLEYCADAGNGLQCQRRMVLALSVQNGQNATESMVTYRLDSATDTEGNQYDILDSVEITLAKTIITLEYPLAYAREFNNGPREIVLRSAGGRSFNWLTNPCNDDPGSASPSCGWVLSDGQRVANSQGFCCRCDASDVLSGTNGATRGGLDCSLFSSNTQSAHCLRMDPLWYSAFSIGPSQLQYSIYAVFRYCRGSGTADQNCTVQVATLGPTAPGACVKLSSEFSAARTNGTANRATTCDAVVNLEGDFAAFADAPDHSQKYLMIPLVCENFDVCGARTLESSDRWLLVDKFMTTTGSSCDRIGVSYAAFQSQGSRCAVPASTCLRYQPQQLYEQDMSAETRGQRGSYFLKNFRRGGEAFVNIRSASTAALRFTTDRFQKTLLTVAIDADSVQYRLKVAPAVILYAAVSTFMAGSQSGSLQLQIANNGTVRSLFTVTVQCSVGIQPVLAKQVTLDAPPSPGSQTAIEFAISTSELEGANYACFVAVSNVFNEVTANTTVLFNTTGLDPDRGEQGGSPETRAPTNDSGTAATRQAQTCEKDCAGALDLVCAVRLRCTGKLWGWAGGVIGLLALAALGFKFPFLISMPLQALAGAATAALRCCGCGSGGAAAATRAQTPQSLRASADVADLARRKSLVEALALAMMAVMARPPVGGATTATHHGAGAIADTLRATYNPVRVGLDKTDTTRPTGNPE